VTNSCAFYILHARLRVHRAPGIPHALIGWIEHAQLGRNRAAGMLTFAVIARSPCDEAIQLATSRR
jgi:hypothetical protein